jgi:hypothetical protein
LERKDILIFFVPEGMSFRRSLLFLAVSLAFAATLFSFGPGGGFFV